MEANSTLQNQIRQSSNKYLSKSLKLERKLKQQFAKTDPARAEEVFGNIDSLYKALKDTSCTTATENTKRHNLYVARIDSMRSGIQYLLSSKTFDQSTIAKEKLQAAISSYDQLQGKLNGNDAVVKYLQNRQQTLLTQLQQTELVQQFNTLKKQLFYYKTSIAQFRQSLETRAGYEMILLRVLNKLPAFQQFFNRYSGLASIFRLPTAGEDLSALGTAGIQTRAQLEEALSRQLNITGAANSALQQPIGNAQSVLNQYKNKLSGLKNGNDDPSLPDFKPNQEKTKRLKDRFEIGMNAQSKRSSNLFPATCDIGLSLGYKLNNRSTAGIGGSYRMGLGKDFRHMALTHQGVGLRSFLDYRLKGSFWLSGGGEMNYYALINRSGQLKDLSAWQTSALLGISKKFKATPKLNGSLQVLYDFLWKQQPSAQKIIVRAGYNIR